MNISEIVKIIEEKEEMFSCFGIRQHHDSVKDGDTLPNSFQQIDDEEAYELDGTCALQFVVENGEEELEWLFEQIEKASYQDGPIIIVAGNSYEYGNDDGEIIISEAEVVSVIQ